MSIKLAKNLLLIAFGVLFMNLAKPVLNTFPLSKDYTVAIHGTSNLHNWDETVETITGMSTINGNSDGSYNLEAASIKMNVYSIKSDKGAVMNNNTYKALKADLYPEIIFMLSAPVKSIQVQSNPQNFSAKGRLSIAGITKSIEIKIKTFMQESGKLTLEGTQTIKMTDYGVNPPTALFGALKTGDEVNIHFKIGFMLNN